MTTAGLLIFGGPIGKSAQFPLHIWLPDAMEGPTPVSALIHAATMVAAGVYLVARLFPFYLFLPDALLVIALVGAFTAIFAAVIGICQFDIKKVLAYSTVSQLGFMMTALGCGGLAAGTMHLMTHAWFKGGLFLCSGSVILGMHHHQDMRQMGGLRKKMPITYVTMLLMTMAISGVPFFSGFYSKDAILAVTQHPEPAYAALGYEAHGFLWKIPMIVIPIAASITAFYMFRLIIMTFHGEPKSEHAEHAHESPWVMTVPLLILAALAVFGASLFNYNELVGVTTWSASAGVQVQGEIHHAEHGLAPLITSLIVAGLGIAASFAVYQFKVFSAERMAKALGPVYRTVYNKFYVDEFVLKFVVRPLVYQWNVWCAAFDKYIVDGIVNNVGQNTAKTATGSGWFDRNIIDGAIETLGFVTQVFGAIARIFQSGFLQHYLTWLAGSAALGLIVFLFVL